MLINSRCFPVMTAWQLGWQLYFVLFIAIVLVPSTAGIALYFWQKRFLKPVLWWLLACAVTYVWTAWWLSHNQIAVSGDTLTVRAGFYRTVIHDYPEARAEIVVRDKKELGDFTPQIAVDGIDLPKYQVGWYVLANRKLAFVMLIGEEQEVSVVDTPRITAIVSGNIQQLNLVNSAK